MPVATCASNSRGAHRDAGRPVGSNCSLDRLVGIAGARRVAFEAGGFRTEPVHELGVVPPAVLPTYDIGRRPGVIEALANATDKVVLWLRKGFVGRLLEVTP